MSVDKQMLASLTQKDQVTGLALLIKRVLNKQLSEVSRAKLQELSNRLSEILSSEERDAAKLVSAFNITNIFLAEIEKQKKHAALLKRLKEEGLYSILYHNSHLQGDMDSGCRMVRSSCPVNEYGIYQVRYLLKNKSGYVLYGNEVYYCEYVYGTWKPPVKLTLPEDPEQQEQIQRLFPSENDKLKLHDASSSDLQCITSLTGHKHTERGMKGLLKLGYVGLAVATVLVLFFGAVAVLGGPFWLFAIAAGLFAGATVYVGALLYGVINDLFATKDTVSYFRVGHQQQQHSMFRTNNPVAIGVGWGVAAVAPLGIIAGVVFAVGVGVMSFFFPPAAFVFPLLLITLPLIAFAADRIAKWLANKPLIRERTYLAGSNTYQRNALEVMAPTEDDRAAWIATGGPRNGFGFIGMPVVAVLALITILVLTGVCAALPAMLFTPMMVVAVPMICTTIAILILAGLGAYMYANRNKQTDDRNKMNFDLEGDLPYEERSFYFDNSPSLVQEILDEKQQENEHFNAPVADEDEDDLVLSSDQAGKQYTGLGAGLRGQSIFSASAKGLTDLTSSDEEQGYSLI